MADQPRHALSLRLSSRIAHHPLKKRLTRQHLHIQRTQLLHLELTGRDRHHQLDQQLEEVFPGGCDPFGTDLDALAFGIRTQVLAQLRVRRRTATEVKSFIYIYMYICYTWSIEVVVYMVCR